MLRSRPVLLVFLAAFGVVLVLAARFFLLPALSTSTLLDHAGRRALAAISILLLAILLVILFLGLLLIVRPARFFLPAKPSPRTTTRYSDAWAESANRLPTPPPDSEQ